jgi:succinate dehydrogenase/fumarate reductase flavoprotein subunit
MGKTEEERDAWEAHVDETIRRLRELAEKGWAELERKRAADTSR